MTPPAAGDHVRLRHAETLDEWHGYILPTELMPPVPDLPAE